jgi:hypothetical protein
MGMVFDGSKENAFLMAPAGSGKQSQAMAQDIGRTVAA